MKLKLMTTEEVEIWRHWDTACEIADAVRIYADSGESLYDSALPEAIQEVLKRIFPTLGKQDNRLARRARLADLPRKR